MNLIVINLLSIIESHSYIYFKFCAITIFKMMPIKLIAKF